jgi:hypothetical protein
MDTPATISNRWASWAALVDVRARVLRLKRNIYADAADDSRFYVALHVFTGRELNTLLARAAFTTWLDQQALGPAPDPQPLPRLHQVFEEVA